ncbi:MAG: NAD-dependent epimerase/dehydratase family protein [Planctomycetota bacterium]|nr:NAD-dependent epimerase/dehydratase family protein [Planctomycetota bacterium]
MKILITGAGGQIGTDLLPLLVARGDTVTVFDLSARPASCPSEVEWVRGDITYAAEVNTVVARARPHRILHLAAILSAAGEGVPHRAYRVNMDGTHNVLEAARLFEVEQVFFTSTIAAFGPGLAQPVGDDVPLRPTTMYGITKVAGELLGEYYERAFGIDFRGVRFPGLINAGIPGGGTSDYALFMYVDGMRKGRYESFCRPDSRIPFMYMPDAIRAMLELMDAPKEELRRSIYNIAAIHPTAQEIANAVKARLPEAQLTFVSDPRRQAILDSWPDALDDSNARRDWGWKHEYDLDAMSDDLIAKLRQLVGAPA